VAALAFVALSIAVCPCTWADPQSEAAALKDSSLNILKATANSDATPAEMAKCIYDLEKAAALLESVHDTDSDLAKEVNTALYWSRKRSTLAIDAALDKLHGGAGGFKPSALKKPDAKIAKTDPNDPGDPSAGMEDARKAYQDAERFAKSHTNDDYVVSLHWFQMASQHPGTDYSLKALANARDAQARFSSNNPNAKKEVIPDTPEMKPVLEGDREVAEKRYTQAIGLYQASLKIKETAVAHRKLGQAYYADAQVVKQAVIDKCTAVYPEWKAARDKAYIMRQTLGGGQRRVFNPNDPAYVEASRKYRAAFAEGDKAFELFDKAQIEFKAVLKLAPNGKDLISAGTIGICLSQKPEPLLRAHARTYIAGFLKDYSPANDDERTVYEYCKTELERISK
jgi:tetratricopeptide (TPR) repeat protein